MNGSKAKVLIIDDDEQILRLLKRIIEAKGLKCITCQSAKEALAILPASAIKVALIDIFMPEMSGLELMKHFQKVIPSLHVIMITGSNDVEIAQECMRQGARDFITKPFDMEYLETSVLAEIIPLI